MSAERRRRDDSLPIDERATDAHGRPGGGRDDWPGDPQADQAWASSYRFDGRRSDEPWRDPSQREDISPAGHAWRHDAAAGGLAGDGLAGDAADSWIDRTQADQSWRYRSLADDQLAAEQDDDWPGLDAPAGTGRHGAAGAGRRASDSWPASTRADESWRDSTAPGAAYRDAGPAEAALDATDPRGAWRRTTDPGAVRRSSPQADEPGRDSSRAGAGRAGGSYAIDPRAVDLTADSLAVDPFATDLFAGDYADRSGPSGTHIVGGRRASDNWLAAGPASDAIPAVGAPGRASLAGGGLTGGATGGGRPGGGRPGDDWDDGGRPGGRRRILVSVMAAVAVALAFGAYGLVRMHDSSALTLQDSSSRPCAAHSGRCHSHHPPRTPAPGSSSPAGISSAPTTSGSPTTGASGSPSTQPTHSAPPASMPASVPPPTHSAPPPPPAKPTPKPSASSSQPSGTASSAAAAQVLTVINQARAQQGLPALAISSGLNTSSAAHTSVMAGDCGLSHQCPGEPPLGTRISNAGVQWTSAGENIGEGGPVANDTSAITQMAVNLTQSMLNEKPPDDGHRMNILSSSFRFIGITVFIDAKGTVWMTQDFSG
jgi:uncharacterized protein YkwD